MKLKILSIMCLNNSTVTKVYYTNKGKFVIEMMSDKR